MSRQSKNAKKQTLAKEFSEKHKAGGKGPTPPKGTFPYAGRAIVSKVHSKKK